MTKFGVRIVRTRVRTALFNMSPSIRLFSLSCLACGHATVCGAGEIVRWLTEHGMLRREKDPDWELLAELFTSSAPSFVCPECENQGLVATPAGDQEDEAWGMARSCHDCGQPIDAERLEVFPDTRICRACKLSEEQGETSGEIMYCPQCGAPMTLKTSRGPGITRYKYRCTQCRG